MPDQVICDGEPLTLPDDIEGVLFLNINSYMGGVDLWASGVDGSGRTGKQSLCDGKLEVPSHLLHCLFPFGVCQCDGKPRSFDNIVNCKAATLQCQCKLEARLCIACSSRCPLYIAEKQRSSVIGHTRTLLTTSRCVFLR